MNQQESTIATAEPDEWVEVGEYDSLHEAFDHSLVVLAMGESCRVTPSQTEGAYQLQADPQPAPEIHRELTEYAEETAAITAERRLRENEQHPDAIVAILLWFFSLCGAFYWQSLHPEVLNQAASSSIGLWQERQWWRPFTSLFLHGDVAHLAGNLLFGSLFLYFLARRLGSTMALFLALLAGTIGNAFNAWLNFPDSFQAIGASTSVFAALGILSGLGGAEFAHIRPRLPWAKVAAPICAGLALLGMLGNSQNPETDVLGHVCGFAAGLIIGVAVGLWETRQPLAQPA